MVVLQDKVEHPTEETEEEHYILEPSSFLIMMALSQEEVVEVQEVPMAQLLNKYRKQITV